MAITLGANHDQLTQLGTRLKAQIASIDGVVQTVTTALGGTEWIGPARTQFEQEWNTTFRTALTRLNDAFDAAGQDCLNRSTELQRVMGAR